MMQDENTMTNSHLGPQRARPVRVQHRPLVWVLQPRLQPNCDWTPVICRLLFRETIGQWVVSWRMCVQGNLTDCHSTFSQEMLCVCETVRTWTEKLRCWQLSLPPGCRDTVLGCCRSDSSRTARGGKRLSSNTRLNQAAGGGRGGEGGLKGGESIQSYPAHMQHNETVNTRRTHFTGLSGNIKEVMSLCVLISYISNNIAQLLSEFLKSWQNKNRLLCGCIQEEDDETTDDLYIPVVLTL